MYRKLKVCVVVPAYNEEGFISEVIETVPDFVDNVVVVDDASTDRTYDKARAQVKKCKGRVILIRHDENQGVGGAIITGHKKAINVGADVSCVMAGDGQMDPHELPKLLEPIADGRADYAKGNRLLTAEMRRNMPPLRQFGNSVLSLMTKFSSGYWSILDPQNGYTAIRRECLEVMPLGHIRKDYLFENDMLVHLNVYNFRVKDVTMKARYGRERSNINTLNFILNALVMLIFRFFWRLKEKYIINDFHPVIFFYVGGLLLTLMGLLGGTYMVLARMVYGFVSAGSLLLPTIFLITGTQFILFAMLFDRDAGRYHV
jgi:glycosyltransferase involved in cell wall biosynthesis